MDGVSKADEEVAKDEPAAHNWEVAMAATAQSLVLVTETVCLGRGDKSECHVIVPGEVPWYLCLYHLHPLKLKLPFLITTCSKQSEQIS